MTAERYSDDLHAITYCNSMIKMYQNEITARQNHLTQLSFMTRNFTIRQHKTFSKDREKRDADRALGLINGVPEMIVKQ
jgi:hypothetical protein